MTDTEFKEELIKVLRDIEKDLRNIDINTSGL